MLKSPPKREKNSRRSLSKLMKRKLSFRTKDRIDSEEFGGTNIFLSGKKNRLPKGMPTEIAFRPGCEDHDDEISCESQLRDLPDLVSAETPIKKESPSSSESSGSEPQTTDRFQSLPDVFQSLPNRFESLQNYLFANRKGLLAVAVAICVCTQVPETTKLQLSVFAAGLSSTIVEQSKTLVTNEPLKTIRQNIKPVTTEKLPAEDLGTFTGKLSRNALEDIPHRTLQEVGNAAIDNFNSGAHRESYGSYDVVTSRILRGVMPEKNGNGIAVQSNNVEVQQDGTNTIIFQNKVVEPEGSKNTILLQPNVEGASIRLDSNGDLRAAAPRAILNGMPDPLDTPKQGQVVGWATQPADDELPPECYNVFKKFLRNDCNRAPGETESRERNWIEALSTDAWILNMDI